MSAGPILIIDDEPGNLATLKQILAADYALVFARSGSEGLAAAKKHLPQLILLDIRMPEMDGYAVCRILKSDPVTENIPVIFVSSLGEVGDESAGFECGGVDYIVKPVSPALVRARVRTHLSLVHASMLERNIRQLEIEQAKTARLSRIHAILSGTNSAIVRIREPMALVEEACRIAVVHGGFDVAWIGLLNDDGTQLVPAARQGGESEFVVQPLDVSTPAACGYMCIPSQVLKTGRVAFCNDIRTLERDSPGCRDAQSQSYMSVVGLPLMAMDRAIGVIVLYVREADYFDDAELKLLSELAGDISLALQAIENEKRASFLSYYDVLTGLPNTDLFFDHLEKQIQAARRSNGTVIVIAINLDRFKQLNDVLGRHVGDQVLRIVAKRLEQGMPHVCRTARTGADNFAVVCEQGSGDDIKLLCEQINALLSAPIIFDEQNLQVTARLGIAIFPADADAAEAIFKNAETALKQAKQAKARYLYYSAEMNARIAERAALESKLKAAVEGNQFVLYYQPKVDLASGRIVGAEALIRWLHPERGLVMPGEFIPLAEESGLIVPIGDWVIRSVCAQQAAWQSAGNALVPVALNLSALQFKYGNVAQTIEECLLNHHLAPACLELEVTESLVMENPEEAERMMRNFRAMGLHLSLDDFGTGYSSLAYLKRFPFDSVKIDRAFVTDVTSNAEDAAIASAIIAMAHILHMNVIAEGVETAAQLKFLRARHCDQIQGYLFSRPVAAAAFLQMTSTGKHLEFESE